MGEEKVRKGKVGGAKGVRAEALLLDTLRRIDRALKELEPKALAGDAKAGNLYAKLLAQRANLALKLRELKGKDELVEWLVKVMAGRV